MPRLTAKKIVISAAIVAALVLMPSNERLHPAISLANSIVPVSAMDRLYAQLDSMERRKRRGRCRRILTGMEKDIIRMAERREKKWIVLSRFKQQQFRHRLPYTRT